MNFLTLNNLGFLLAVVLAVVLGQRYGGLRRARALPRYGQAGAWLLIASMAGAALEVAPVKIFFTPLCWTGYILWADGAVAALRGRSLGNDNRRAFWLLAGASVPLWMVFELYNLRLHNWLYAGLPLNPPIRFASFLWAFATIWPGIFVTAALLRAMGWFNEEDAGRMEHGGNLTSGGPWGAAALAAGPARDRSPGAGPVLGIAVGALFLIVPPMLPQTVSVYLFGLVWLGPVLLLEPLNWRAGRESLWADWLRGDRARLGALLAAGAICGLLWEYWNHTAAARWYYTFPIFHEYRIFAMPLPGYLGFPVFALDCFAMYALVEPALHRLTRTPRRDPAVLSL